MATTTVTNLQAGVICRLCSEKIGVGNPCKQMTSGWSYHLDCWRTRESRHWRPWKGGTAPQPAAKSEPSLTQLEREVEGLDKELATLIPGHVSYANEIDDKQNPIA